MTVLRMRRFESLHGHGLVVITLPIKKRYDKTRDKAAARRPEIPPIKPDGGSFRSTANSCPASPTDERVRIITHRTIKL
jgi:hypothetical protein